jgi:hypothetical protein
VKFEAEMKGSADRITKKKLEVETELSSKREIQLGDVALQAQHAQERELLQDLLDDCSRALGPVFAAQSQDRE